MSDITIHYLDSAFVNADRLSTSRVKSKVKAGWVWHKLVPGFGSVAGISSYRRALINPVTHEFAFVSDYVGGPDLEQLPALNTSYTLLKLNVPFEQKGEAKDMGAVWIGWRKTWACAPFDAEKFSKWIGDQREYFDLMDE